MNDVLQKMEPHEKVREKDLKGERQRPILIVRSYTFIFLRKIWQNHFFLEYKNVSFFYLHTICIVPSHRHSLLAMIVDFS